MADAKREFNKVKLNITIDDITVAAELNDSATARALYAALPFDGRANRWGDEIYFDVPVTVDLAGDAVQDVPVGTLAYWPTGAAMCIFFGPTPVSVDDTPRAYSPVNIFGKIIGDTEILKKIKDGAAVSVRAAS